MTCAFCRATPVNPCPVCTPAPLLITPPMRKAKRAPMAATFQAPKVATWAINPSPAVPLTGFAPGGTLGSRPTAARLAANDARIAELRNALVASQVTKPAPRPVPAFGPSIAATVVSRPPRVATVTPIRADDWHAAARFTLDILRGRPMLVDSTCKPAFSTVALQDEVTQIHVGVRPGDWAGLARAVEAGHLSHCEAVSLAASWKSQAVAS